VSGYIRLGTIERLDKLFLHVYLFYDTESEEANQSCLTVDACKYIVKSE